jgi:threonine aldolase
MPHGAGIDTVSFGGTKNGLMGVEAAVIFDPALAWEFELRRKRGAHLYSKHRYLSAQMLAYLTDDLWLRSARAANAKLQALVAGLRACGLEVVSFARKEMDPTDTRAVYRIRAPMVLEAAAALNVDNADAILLSGTGMPTLRVMSQLAQRTGRPVLSSNLCLAWAMLKLAGVEPPAARKELGEALLGGWVERAARL